MRQGQLVYVMGASGSGKDSLLQALRPRLRGVPVAFARRYITRPLSAKGERHIAVSPERFAAMAASGEFMMHRERRRNNSRPRRRGAYERLAGVSARSAPAFS